MKLSKVEKAVLVLICLSLAVGIFTMYQRANIEKQYKDTEITLDYLEINNLAKNSDESMEWWLNKFKEWGCASVVIQEETINSLVKEGREIKAEMVCNLIKIYNWEERYSKDVVDAINNKEINETDVVITIKDNELYNYVLTGLQDRYPDKLYRVYADTNNKYIVMYGQRDDLYYSGNQKVLDAAGEGVYEEQQIVDSRLFNIGIGYDDEKINLVKKSGLDIILRPINYPVYNEKLVDAYAAANVKYDIQPRLYIPYGKEILGYPDNEDKLLKYIQSENISPVLIESNTQREHIEQDGMNDLVIDNNYSALRAFTMWDFIRYRYKYYNYNGAEEIENTMFRAITERNIRLIYFKPIFEERGTYLTDVAEYERTFDSLKERLSEHNIPLGKAKPIKEFHIGSKRLAVISFGITLASVFLFIKMFKLKFKYVDWLYLAAVPGAILPMVSVGLAQKGFAFIAAVVFSGLAIYLFMMQIRKILNSKKELTLIQMMMQSAIILIIMIAIALSGAIFVDSMLSDVRYMLEMDIFRGVKFSQLMPFLVLLITYVLYFVNKREEDNLKGIIKTTKTILNKDIKVYYALLAGVVAVVGYIYISRTGHETTIQPTNIEMIFRNFMENVLLARPRTKEFLIAFPAVFAAVFAANKKSDIYTALFMLLAAVGTSSVINTFCHLRTPLYLSFTRTFIAVVFGIVIGCVLIVILNFIYKLYIKLQERLN